MTRPKPPLRTLLAFAAAAALTFHPVDAAAQWVSSVGDDATVPGPGMLRIGLTGHLQDYDRRFARTGDGTMEPLGADFGTFDIVRLPNGGAIDQQIRALAGVPNLTLTLGDLDVRLRGRVERVPMNLELGVLPRLSVGLMLPIVRTRSTVIVGPRIGTGATAGLNPALTFSGALTHNTNLGNAFGAASQQLRARIQQCQGSADPACAAINENPAAAAAFADAADQFRQHFIAVYVHGPVVPVSTSPADQAIVDRIGTFRAQFQAYGVGALEGAPERPIGAAPIAYEELQTLVTSPQFGILADPLVTVERTSIGDIETGARFLVVDGIDPTGARATGVRLLVSGLVRFGTGSPELVTNLVDIGTGDGQTDVEAAAVFDVVLGRRFALTARARHTRQLEDELLMRVPEFPGQPFVPATRAFNVQRNLGDITAFEAVPRFAFNEWMAVAGFYSVTRRQADRHTLAVDAASEVSADVDPAVLDVGTGFTAHNSGFGVAFSNLAAYRRGRARLPYEISYLHSRTRRGTGGVVPVATEERLQLRLYWPIWRR